MTFIEKRRHYRILMICLIAVLLVAVIFASTLGAAKISFGDCIKIIVSRIPLLQNLVDIENVKPTYITIIFNIRLPRIILSAIIGIGLSVVGTAYQGLFKNPMADPYVLGVSTGAAFGATLAIVFGVTSSFLGLGGVTICAFIGAIGTTLFVYSISRVGSKISTVHLLLAGVTVSFLLSSIISLMMIFNRSQIEKIVLWTMGSVSAASWTKVGLLLPIVLIGSVLIYTYARDLNAILMGDEAAKSMGVEVERVKKVLMIISSVVVAAIVSVSGVIGFVGLIIPHTIRLIIGSDNRGLIPLSSVVGAIFMIVCDTLSRVLVPPIEVPVGAITALFGAPYFLYLLSKSKGR